MNRIVREINHNHIRLCLVHGDITAEVTDVIVNAANSRLLHGGGVAGAISRKGGPLIQQESLKIAPIPTGSCGMTNSGQLPCKKIIHAVGPVWGEGNEASKLRSAVQCALSMAELHGFKTISLPAISSGIFGYPKEENARVIMQAIFDFIDDKGECHLSEIRLCIIDSPTLEFFLPYFS